VFASDAEALKAAEAAYAAYLKVSDQVLIDGGAKPERLLAVATEAVYQEELEGFEAETAKGWHGVGSSRLDGASLQQYTPDDPNNVVTVYLCTDISGLDVLDSSGQSVVSPSRPSRTAFEVSFAVKSVGESDLLVSNKQVWTGGGVC